MYSNTFKLNLKVFLKIVSFSRSFFAVTTYIFSILKYIYQYCWVILSFFLPLRQQLAVKQCSEMLCVLATLSNKNSNISFSHLSNIRIYLTEQCAPHSLKVDVAVSTLSAAL